MKQEKNIWEQSRVELFQKLDCRETGLSQEDAADRLAKYGANELHAGKQKSVLQIFLGQFADFLVLILILAAVISASMGDVESMIVILAVITMNAILGTVQTVKASASLDSLKQMSAPTAKVLRDGQIVQIPGREVVPGDVVQAVRHMRAMNSEIRRIVGMAEDEIYEAAKQLQVPVELVRYVHENGKLPVVNFAAGGVATPADAALMMQLGAEGVFVGSGIFKSGNPAKRAAAIVKAVTNYQDAKLIAELSEDLGEAMVGINESEIEILMAERGK